MTAERPRWQAPAARVWNLATASGTVFLLTAAVGIATMSRSVGFVDRGELAAVATTLGVAHPTGYPTLTLLGHLATRLFPLRPVLALDLLAALLVAAGAALLVPLYDEVLRRIEPAPARVRRAAGTRPGTAPPAPAERAGAIAESGRAMLAALAALATAFTATWWRQANGFEAYALHAFLLPIVTLLFLRFVDRGKGGQVFALSLGLSFTNHLTTLLLAPGFLAYALVRLGWRRGTLLRFLRLAPAFLLGLLPYSWLPLRAAQSPRFNWGDPETLDGFLRHVTGWQFRVWMFSSPQESKEQAAYLLQRLPWDLGWLGLVPVALGAAALARRARPTGLLALLLFVASYVYACGYGITDIDPYVLAGVMALGAALAAGMLRVRERFGLRAACGLGAALVTLNLAIHWRACDQSDDRLAEDHATNLLAPLPRNAVLLSEQWDHLVSPSYYLQEVEGMRRDVLIVDPRLLRYTWYVRELAHRAPEPMAAAAKPADAYVRLENRFERGQPYDREEIRAAYHGFVRAFLAACLAGGRPLFTTPEVDVAWPPGLYAAPFHLTVAMTAESAYVSQEFPHYRHRRWRGPPDPYVAVLAWSYGRALSTRGAYEARHGHPDLAERYRRYALEFDPGFRASALPPQPVNGRDRILLSIGFFERLRASLSSPP